ncbi:glycine cleavage system aminomethyltransferase GcvT [Niveibacterium terrae]|uniref:glycine cleavage system aminomethyltransferase GcvT n=1 Tax=Niveibacterium terrae TaxID=3373598 RepID=UPI003A8DA765
MGKQTPLYEQHVAAGAKIVDFAGWDMPIHYGSQLDEHHQVRRDAGMFDVSHMLPVDVSGAGSQSFLAHLLANDIGRLSVPGKALYSCMLQEDGGVVDDLITYFFAPDDYRIVVNAGTADKDIAWMRTQAANTGANVTISPRRDLAMIAVQGPNARARTWAALPGSQAASEELKPFQAARWQDLMICRTGYTGEDGFELIVPASRAVEIWQALAAAGVKPVGLGARDTLRLEAGMNLYGSDMDESKNPLESGLAWTVSFNDGRDFVGRAALEAWDGSRQLVGLKLIDRGVLRSHMRVITAHGEGETTSGSFAPTLNASIAFARIPAGVAPGDTVEVEIRGKLLPARVGKLAFARNGKALA